MVERLELAMDPEYVPIWLNEPLPALGESKPLDLIGGGQYRKVASVISGLEGTIAVWPRWHSTSTRLLSPAGGGAR